MQLLLVESSTVVCVMPYSYATNNLFIFWYNSNTALMKAVMPKTLA